MATAPRFELLTRWPVRRSIAAAFRRFDRMITYSAFGIRLESDLELPEIERAANPAGIVWRFERGAKTIADGWRLLGTDTVYHAVSVAAYSAPGIIRLVYDDTGTFEVFPDERRIVFHPGPAATDEAIRADLLGRVMAFVALATGALPLHASAVCIDGRAIALVGPKGSGKSTLALTLVHRGARLITDDTLVVGFDRGEPWASPGVHRVRLWDDSAAALGIPTGPRGGAKPTHVLSPEERQHEAVPLVACYIVRPVVGLSVMRREPLSPVRAALSCVGFSKLGSLAGGDAGVTVLERSTRLTQAVPFYSADMPRDFSALRDVSESLFAWHGSPTTSAPNVTVGC